MQRASRTRANRRCQGRGNAWPASTRRVSQDHRRATRTCLEAVCSSAMGHPLAEGAGIAQGLPWQRFQGRPLPQGHRCLGLSGAL